MIAKDVIIALALDRAHTHSPVPTKTEMGKRNRDRTLFLIPLFPITSYLYLIYRRK